MDAIQKTLVKAGRKDLAIKYYHKVTSAVKEFKDKKDFLKASSSFISKVKSKAVYLSQNKSYFEEENGIQIWNVSFDVFMDASDPYLNASVYKKGEAYIYLSKKFYSDVNSKAKELFGKTVEWNNTRTSGYISGYIKK